MMQYNSRRFESIKAKINRAEDHLLELEKIDSKFKTVDCSLTVEKEPESNRSYLLFNLPSPPSNVPIIVGDCLSNLRSSLDYLIWQIVDSNLIASPTKSTMFPICTTKKQFDQQIKRKRLHGLPQTAIQKVVEMQPFASPQNHVLDLLNELSNKDKHRDLNYSISVASDIMLTTFKNGMHVSSIIIGNDEIKNGEVFGNITFNDSLLSGKEVEFRGRAQAYLAFKDIVSEFDDDEVLPVVSSLNEITEFIKQEVVDSLINFLK